MISKIPWLSNIKDTESELGVLIDTHQLIKFIKSTQNPEGFYNSLEESFFAIIGQIKLGKFSDINQSAIISHVLKHRIITGGYSSKIGGEVADIESTFYAIGLFYIAGVFLEDSSSETTFCPECGQKQLFETQLCFNCNGQITPELTNCAVCNKSFQGAPSTVSIQKPLSTEGKWTNLCETCQSGFLQDLKYIQNIQKQGFKEEGKKPSYKTAFFTLSTLIILGMFDEVINFKKVVEFLQKNQFPLEIERLFQILCFYLLKDREKIDFLPLLNNLTEFQYKDSGFGFDTKNPGISDTFWGIAAFFLMKKLDSVQLGPIYKFVSGLKRESDGGYAGKLMDPRSNIISTIQSYLIFQMVSDCLHDRIEETILKEALLGKKIFLTPLAERNSISLNIVESIAYQLLSEEWFAGKVLDQLDLFQDYLDKSNVLTQKIGKSLINIAMTQSEINLSEFSKGLDLENAEERVKTVLIDFLAKKFVEGEIRKGKKGFIFQEVKLPRKFILLEKEVPVDALFKEKAQIPSKCEFLETQFHQLVISLKKIQDDISSLIEQGDTTEARKKVELENSNILHNIEEFEKQLTTIPSEFKYIDFKEIMVDFFNEWPANRNALTIYLTKIQEPLIKKIELKEKSKAHDALISKEQRITENFGEYIRIYADKMDLLSQNFKTSFQQQYTNQQLAHAQIAQINDNIHAFSQDFSEKKTQFEGSLEISQKSEKMNKSLDLLNSKIKLLKEIADQASKVLNIREDLPKQLDETHKNFKDQLMKSQSLINEKITNKEFDLASKELESQDEHFKKFKLDIRQKLEALIYQNKATFPHFIVSFDDIRNQLTSKLNQLENEWTTQKEELISKSLEQTELHKKIQLKNKINNFIASESDKFEALKLNIEKSIKQENIQEAKSKVENTLSEFNQLSAKFEIEINESIKEISKQFKNYKKNTSEIVLGWNKDKSFIQQSMQTLLDQVNNILAEKDLLTQKIKLELMIKNQKILLSKQFSLLLQQYPDSIEKNTLLNQETPLLETIKTIQTNFKKGTLQISLYVKETSKKFGAFSDLVKTQMEFWQKESGTITNLLEKIESNISENILIQKIYFVIKAFQGYKVELKYLSKAINVKISQLKDNLVSLLSNSKLLGNLDPITDMLTLSTLKPITEATQSFLKIIQEEIGQILQIDFMKKEQVPKEIEEKKQNLLQLRYLLVIHRVVGATLFHRQFGTWEINPDLISGFLTAIQSFGSEIKSETAAIRKMAYKGFEILLNQGELTFAALIVDGATSEWHEKKLAEFNKEFEREFHNNLKNWSGELTQFKSAGLMIDRIFELFRVFT